MTRSVRFEYPIREIALILRNSYQEDAYYGVDLFESRRLKIVLAKYGCRQNFHTLPGKVMANLHPFTWDHTKQVFRIDMNRKIAIQLNTLETAVVNHPIFEQS